MTARAVIRDEFHHHGARLLIAIDDGPDHTSYLMADGTWLLVDNNVEPPADVGIFLRAEAVDAVAAAFHPRAGHTIEVKRLEEALEIERRRVDQTLGWALR